MKLPRVFDDFYTKLYGNAEGEETELEHHKNRADNDVKETNEIPEITTEEL